MDAELNNKKNVILSIAVAFLLMAMFDGLSYEFFIILRFVVFSGSAYVAWLAYELQGGKWTWVFGLIAVLFNPIIPIHLTREIWMPIDLVTAIFLFVAIFSFKLRQ